MDLDAVPDDLAADDGLTQAAINGVLNETTYNEHVNRAGYKNLPVKRVPLSRYRDIYDGEMVREAFKLMQQRVEIEVDPEMVHDPNDVNLAWDLSKRFLDFLLVVADNVGFGAILPSIANDHHFVFHLDLHQPARPFKLKHGSLGFSRERSLLYVGKSRGKDEVWVGMAPHSYFLPELDRRTTDEPVKRSEVSNLQGHHYWMIVMYLAYVLNKALPHRSIYCADRYPQISSNAAQNVKKSTNIL